MPPKRFLVAGSTVMETKQILEISRDGDVAVARFKGNCICDTEEIAGASAALKRYIETHHPGGLIFDFTGVKFFSSQVLGLLLEARARLQPNGGRVAVTALSPQLQRVFKITSLDKIFTLHADLATALAAVTT